MNLYLISQDENNGYDTFDSAIVAAESEDQAKLINPDEYVTWDKEWSRWCTSPDKVTVKYIGIAADDIKQGVILSSFNAS